MLAHVLLMTLLSATPPEKEPPSACAGPVSEEELEEESLLTHPYWKEWLTEVRVKSVEGSGSREELELSFTAVHPRSDAPPRFRAPLALPPPLTGALTVTFAPSARKREGDTCIQMSLTTDPDRQVLRELTMENAPLRFRASVKNAGLPLLDVTWEGQELTYREEAAHGQKALFIPSPPTAQSGLRDRLQVLLGDARAFTQVFESQDEHGMALLSLTEFGLTWEKLLRSSPPARVSRDWRQLVLELIHKDLAGPLDPRDTRRAERVRMLEPLLPLQVDASAEPLWGPLLRAWAARLRPPSRPRASIGQAALSLVPAAGGNGTNGSIDEVWVDGRRILCPGCSEPTLKGVTTAMLDVPPERAVRLWVRWKNMDGFQESEEWMPLLPGTRYRLRYAWLFRSASDQKGRIDIEPESGARGEQPACVTIEASAQVAPGLGWAELRNAYESEVGPPSGARLVAFGASLPATSKKHRLAIFPVRGATELTRDLWTMLPVHYVHAGSYRLVLEKDGTVRLRFSPEAVDCAAGP